MCRGKQKSKPRHVGRGPGPKRKTRCRVRTEPEGVLGPCCKVGCRGAQLRSRQAPPSQEPPAEKVLMPPVPSPPLSTGLHGRPLLASLGSWSFQGRQETPAVPTSAHFPPSLLTCLSLTSWRARGRPRRTGLGSQRGQTPCSAGVDSTKDSLSNPYTASSTGRDFFFFSFFVCLGLG